MLSVAAPAAQAEMRPGIRAGAMIDPDGFLFGGHLAFEGFPGLGGLRAEPGIELGIGDEFFMFRFLGHGKYMFDFRGSPVRAFPLFGLEVSYFNVDAPGAADDDFTEVGLNLGGGAEFFGKLAVQMYFGVGDVPDINVVVLYDF